MGLLVLSLALVEQPASNLFSYLVKDDVALSIALNTIASFIMPFTIPFLTELALQMQLVENKDIVVPIGLTMKRLFMVTILLPVVIGMGLRILKPTIADKIRPWIHRISVCCFEKLMQGFDYLK